VNVLRQLYGFQSAFDVVLVDPPFGEVSSGLGLDYLDPTNLFCEALTRGFQSLRPGGRLCSILLDTWLDDRRVSRMVTNAYDIHRIEDTRLIVMCIEKTGTLEYGTLLQAGW
jgi:hypothetical protein